MKRKTETVAKAIGPMKASAYSRSTLWFAFQFGYLVLIVSYILFIEMRSKTVVIKSIIPRRKPVAAQAVAIFIRNYFCFYVKSSTSSPLNTG